MAQEYESPTVEDGRVEIDGVEVHYATAGTVGPAVVLLHGGGLDSSSLSFSQTIPSLAESFHVFAPDWPGYGESDVPVAPYSIEYFADVLDSFLDALNVDHTSLVGSSMGGAVAIEYALRRPERVDRLVLVASAGLGPDRPGLSPSSLLSRSSIVTGLAVRALARSKRLTARALRRVVAYPDSITPDLVDDVREAARRVGASHPIRRTRRFEAATAGSRADFDDRLSALAVPTMLVHGEHDSIVPVSRAIRARTLIPGADLRVVDCGHWPTREWPAEVNRVLGEFLTEPVPAD